MVLSMRRMRGTKAIISSASRSQVSPTHSKSTTVVAVKRLYFFRRSSSPWTNIPNLLMEGHSRHLDEDILQGGLAAVQGLDILGLEELKEFRGLDFLHGELFAHHIPILPILHLDNALAILELEI